MTKPPSRSIRRRIALLLLLLLAGVVINVAVAWGSSVLGCTPLLRRTEVPVAFPQQRWPQAHSDTCQNDIFEVDEAFRYTATLYVVMFSQDCACSPPFDTVLSVESGFPAYSMAGWMVSAGGWHAAESHPIWFVACFQKLSWLPSLSGLPFMPLWPGFAINTVFYAALCWALFCGPFVIRRWRRRRKGLCSACAYPVGESPVCTECGHSVRGAAQGRPNTT